MDELLKGITGAGQGRSGEVASGQGGPAGSLPDHAKVKAATDGLQAALAGLAARHPRP